MSNIDIVTEMVEKMGEATVKSVFAAMQDLPEDDRLTRQQVAAALHNARAAKAIAYIRHDPRPDKHSRRPIVYGPITDDQFRPTRPATTGIRPVSSVFELGDRAAQAQGAMA